VALNAVQRRLNIPIIPVAYPGPPPVTTVAPQPCPDLCVASKKSSGTAKFLKAAGKLGVAALRTGAASGAVPGLHCPVCRILR